MRIFLTCILFLSFLGFSQQNFWSFELAGAGGFGSINFEHKVLDKEKLDIHMRYGFSIAPVDPNNGTNLVFPIMAHFLYGSSKHKFDAGIGQALSVTTKLGLFISAPMSFGYRLQPEDKNLYWRFAYTPLVSYIVDFQWQHWGGITFGYHFNRKKNE